MVYLGRRIRSHVNLGSYSSFKTIERVAAKFGKSLTKYIMTSRLYFFKLSKIGILFFPLILYAGSSKISLATSGSN